MKSIFDASKARGAAHALTLGSVLTLAACGGGGGGGGDQLAGVTPPGGGGDIGGGAGIGGTGFSSTGTIDGAGSIFVNGVRYDIDDAEIFVNGEPATEADLKLGMVVVVAGTDSTAERVDYSPQLEGPVTRIERNTDNTSARVIILGQTVIIESKGTVFDDVSFDTIAVGDRLEISGNTDSDGRLRATRVEREDDADQRVQLTGTVTGLAGLEFRIGNQAIDAARARLENLPGGSLADGQRVKVEGELLGDVLVADEVEGRQVLSAILESGDDVTVAGAISDYVSNADFRVEGLPVDASGAALAPADLGLGNGSFVEVVGSWNGEHVIATAVNARRGRIELDAPLAAINTAANTFTLQFGPGTVEVSIDARTLFDDDRDGLNFLRLSDLAVGDYLEVEAIQSGATLLATRVDRDDDGDTEIQAPVESFVTDVSVTLLGLTFNVTGADFEDSVDNDISRAAFFANLRSGALINVEDDAPADGFAEEVEFEFPGALPGVVEFDDDDEERITEADLPREFADFLAANFPDGNIALIKRDDDEIEVYLADGSEISFDLDDGDIDVDLNDDSDNDGIDTPDDDDTDGDGIDTPDDDDTDGDGIDTPDDDDTDGDGIDTPDDDDTDGDGIDTPDDDDTDGDGIDTPDDDDEG